MKHLLPELIILPVRVLFLPLLTFLAIVICTIKTFLHLFVTSLKMRDPTARVSYAVSYYLAMEDDLDALLDIEQEQYENEQPLPGTKRLVGFYN